MLARRLLVAGRGGSFLATLMARFLRATPTDLFAVTHGVAEFDLIISGGNYVFIYTHSATEEMEIRHASTVAGLSSASVDATVSGKYPGIQYDGSTWHIWCQQPSVFNLYHYRAPALTGTWSLAASFGAGRSDPQCRQDPMTGLWYLAYLNTVPTYSDWFVGLYESASPNGPWTDLGLVFDYAGHIWDREYDPCPAFYNGSAYLTCTVLLGSDQHILMAELDRANGMRAKTQGVVIESPNGGPVFLDEGTVQRVYYNTATAWGYIEAAG